MTTNTLTAVAPWAISGLAMLSTWVIGNKHRHGWTLNVVACSVTIIYNVITHQYGFIVCNAYAVAMSVRNYRLWKRDDDTSR